MDKKRILKCLVDIEKNPSLENVPLLNHFLIKALLTISERDLELLEKIIEETRLSCSHSAEVRSELRFSDRNEIIIDEACSICGAIPKRRAHLL